MKKIIFSVLSLFSLNFAISQNLPSEIPSSGLFGYWGFSGNANDLSGNNYHGLTNSTTLTTDRFGKPNSAYSFNGTSSYIDVFNKFDSQERTISLWFKSAEFNGNVRTILSNDYGNLNYGHTLINIDNDIIVPQSGTIICSKEKIKLDTWYSVIITRDATKTDYYLNGNLICSEVSNTLSSSASYSNTNNLRFGVDRNDGRNFKGSIDDIGIWTRVLTAKEIELLTKRCINHEPASISNLPTMIANNNEPIKLKTNFNGVFEKNNFIKNDTLFANKSNKLGKNTFSFKYTNSYQCEDSTDFSIIIYDTLGTFCETTQNDTLKIQVKITLGNNIQSVNTLKVYPNPTSNLLTIDLGNFKSLENYSINIHDLQGRIIYNEKVVKQLVTISLTEFGSNGLYILEILDKNNVLIESSKILLEN
jgi:hypothetical protein